VREGRTRWFAGTNLETEEVLARGSSEDLMDRLRRSIPYQRVPLWKGQLIAVACVLGGALVRWPLESFLLVDVPFITYFPAVLVSAVWGGTRAGMTSLLLAIMVAGFRWFEPAGEWGQAATSGASLAAFAVFGGAVVFVAEVLRGSLKELAASEERSRLLASEMGHRVKNALAIATAISRQTARTVGSVAEYRAALEGRFSALALAQDLATIDVSQAADLSDLFRRVLAPFDAGRCDISGAPFRLAQDLTSMMALLIHELATNATKYGALSVAGGRVRIAWFLETGMLVVDWQELGGPEVTEPSRAGFGARLMQSAFPKDRATVTVDYRPDGLRCRISVEASRADGQAAAGEAADGGVFSVSEA